MRTFKRTEEMDKECPICKTKAIKDTILVPIAGTEDGNLYQAVEVHLDCILEGAVYYQDINFIVTKGKD